MTSRILTIAALLMVGAALGATPVLAAAAVQGNRGPAEKPVTRDAPLTLPGPIVAKATPRVNTETLSRGVFDQDPALALAGLATVTLSRDGSISQTDASEALRGIFETEIQGHQTSK